LAKQQDDTPFLPFPFWDVSNEEWCPRPPNERQALATRIFFDEMDQRARRVGMTRRQFLSTAAATATAFWALNVAHGLPLEGTSAPLAVTRDQGHDPQAAAELFRLKCFIMDVQLHHVDLTDPRLEDKKVAALNSCFRFLPADLKCTPGGLALLSQANLLKEVFVDSDTHVGIISGVPSSIIIGPKAMAQTRDLVNQTTGSQRCYSQAVCSPLTPKGTERSIDSLEHQLKELHAVPAMKVYTYDGGWWLDDEKVSYPMLAEASRLGIRIVNVHKGVPLGDDTYVETRDLPKVIRDWPHLTFVIYHSGYFYNRPGKEIDGFLATLRSLTRAEKGRVYAELGTSFAIAFTQSPAKAANLVGALLKELGPRNVIWGTDSIWWGSPQWQIQAFKSLTIPEEMQHKYGYPALTDQVKARILGENAAALYGLKPKEILHRLGKDQVSALREEQSEVGRGPSHYVYGIRTRRDFLTMLRAQEARSGD
jgi:predicted TIM-barrel fold metal-dependent hydrolase